MEFPGRHGLVWKYLRNFGELPSSSQMSRDSYVLYLFHSGWFSPYCLSNYCTVVILYIYTQLLELYIIVYIILHHKLLLILQGIGLITTTCHGHGRCKRKLPTRRVRQKLDGSCRMDVAWPTAGDWVERDGAVTCAAGSIDNNQDNGCQYICFVSHLTGYTLILRRCWFFKRGSSWWHMGVWGFRFWEPNVLEQMSYTKDPWFHTP